MVRLLTDVELAILYQQHPELWSGSPLPEDGIVVAIIGVGCVFGFEKTDGTRIFAEVSDIFPNCTRQVLPAPETLFDAFQAALGNIGAGAEKLIGLAVGVLVVVLVLQTGILKNLFARG